MPENETLVPSPRIANRWNPLRERIADGESLDHAFPDIQTQFYAALKRVFREWNARGVPPEVLFHAAVDSPELLRDLINQTWRHPYAMLLGDAIAGDPNATLDSVLCNFLHSVWGEVRDLLQLDCSEGPTSETFQLNVSRMLDRLLRGLKNDQSKIPRRPQRRELPPDIDDILDEKLPLV